MQQDDSLVNGQAQLMAAMVAANATAFQTNDTPGYTKCQLPAAVEATNHGFVGIVCSADEEL